VTTAIDHHPVFADFPPVEVPTTDAFIQESFLGTVRRKAICELPYEGETRDGEVAKHPSFDEEYYEWIDLLETVRSARDSYTFVELGAGFGRWSVRAALAAQRRGLHVRVVAAEPEHSHFTWMEEHFRVNGLDPADHVLIEAAVSGVDGIVAFTVAAGDQELSDLGPSRWYGQSIERRHRFKHLLRRGLGHLEPSRKVKWVLEDVPAVSLPTVLDECGVVDLVDLDVQGAELTILAAHIGRATEQIKRIHVGTHSRAIETGLRQLMPTSGWVCVADWPGETTNVTPFGTSEFGDGVQSWVNPHLS
jgi:FkbM family methyltransferase